MSSTEQPPTPDDDRWYRISQVSRIAGVKSSVLRYWEGEFPMLQPAKSTTGYRIYRQEDVELVLTIKRLVYEQGLTIAGARRRLEDAAKGQPASPENGTVANASAAQAPANSAAVAPANVNPAQANGNTVPVDRHALLELRDALRDFLTLLERK